jgi:hypothetical protein
MTTCRGCGALFTEGHDEKVCELVAQSMADRRDWLDRESKYIDEVEAVKADLDALALDYADIQVDRDKLQTELFNARQLVQTQAAKLNNQLQTLLKRDARIFELEAERDALALQLKASEENAHQQRDMKAKAREQRDALVSKMVLMHESVSQAVNLIPAGAIDIISNLKAAQDMNTAQALAEIRAEAGRAGFVAGFNKWLENQENYKIRQFADEYAEQIRQGGAK